MGSSIILHAVCFLIVSVVFHTAREKKPFFSKLEACLLNYGNAIEVPGTLVPEIPNVLLF